MSATKIDETKNVTYVKEMDVMLHSFLGWLKGRFHKNADEAGDSQSLLGMGLKDQFAQQWETFINNPIDAMYQTRKSIDLTLHGFINAMVEAYFNKKSQLIANVYWANSGDNALNYCIILKEDTLENRIDVNDFFDFYDEYSLSENYPVYFHFVPKKYVDNIKYHKQIV